MLACGIEGTTLPLQHGFPLRAVIPWLLGGKNASALWLLRLLAAALPRP